MRDEEEKGLMRLHAMCPHAISQCVVIGGKLTILLPLWQKDAAAHVVSSEDQGSMRPFWKFVGVDIFPKYMRHPSSVGSEHPDACYWSPLHPHARLLCSSSPLIAR